MLAVPPHDLQSTYGFACPEVVLTFMYEYSIEMMKTVSFRAQEAWSLGCILVWLLTGENPFFVSEEEAHEKNLVTNDDILDHLSRKQEAVVSRLTLC